MVGIPRSKGCTTCRRRKIACDQQKPHCSTCQNRGLLCEGYAKYPVVLQWTPSGLKKRNRFEENRDNEKSRTEDTILSGIDPSQISSDRDILYRQIRTGQIILQQIEVQCLDSYLPSTGLVETDVKGSWMWSIIGMNDLGRTLTSAFAALSFARVGAMNQDQTLLAQSRVQYSSALTMLKQDLQSSGMVFQDKTLAAMRTLSIYEHLSPTFAPTPPGRVHEDGMAQWCLAAGPQSISTPFGIQIFHDVRWCIMGHSIQSRKKSILGDEQWRTVPWHQIEKDSLQRLFDIGFDLAALLEQIDTTCSSDLGNEKDNILNELWSKCFAVFQQLEMWHAHHWVNETYKRQSQRLHDFNETSNLLRNDQTSLPEFESLWEATNMIYYWTFKLILDDNIVSLSHQYAEEPSPSPDQQFSSSPTAVPKSKASPRQSVVAAEGLSASQLEQISNTSRTLAADIVSAAPYFLVEETGWLGPQRLFFPLKAAMQHLAKIQSPLFTEAQAAFKNLLGRLRSSCGNRV